MTIIIVTLMLERWLCLGDTQGNLVLLSLEQSE